MSGKQGTADPDASIDDFYFAPSEREQLEKPLPAVSAPPLDPGDFQIGGEIGSGAFARVHVGLNQKTGELVAIKTLLGLKEGENEIAAVQREVIALCSFHHPNIVSFYGSFVKGAQLHFVMEYVSGGSIATMMSKFGRLEESIVSRYTQQLLEGLFVLHAHRVLHRDIKCANILVSTDGVVKLSDFGASRQLIELLSGESSIRGTPVWMAPEVLRGESYGRQSDIWSLGCTVLEMATGLTPWTECHLEGVELLMHIATGNVTPHVPDFLSETCRDFVQCCLKVRPLDRPNVLQLLKHPFIVTQLKGRPVGRPMWQAVPGVHQAMTAAETEVVSVPIQPTVSGGSISLDFDKKRHEQGFAESSLTERPTSAAETAPITAPLLQTAQGSQDSVMSEEDILEAAQLHAAEVQRRALTENMKKALG